MSTHRHRRSRNLRGILWSRRRSRSLQANLMGLEHRSSHNVGGPHKRRPPISPAVGATLVVAPFVASDNRATTRVAPLALIYAATAPRTPPLPLVGPCGEGSGGGGRGMEQG